MLGIEHSYYSHITNEEVTTKANLVMNEATNLDISWEQFKIDSQLAEDDCRNIVLVGDLILARQQKLLGHILREAPNTHMRKVSLDWNLQRPQMLHKRTGKPRLNWIDDNLERTYLSLHGTSWEYSNQTKIDQLKQDAEQRLF